MKTILLSIVMSLALAGAANAQEPFQMRGMGGSQAPIQLIPVEGSVLVDCRSGSPSMMRCFRFDSHRTEEIKDAYGQQVIRQGWEATQPRAGAAEGLRVFRPANATAPCPNAIMFVPDTDARFAMEPPNQGQAAYVISYSPDLMCLGQSR